jgi:hypothetical protein
MTRRGAVIGAGFMGSMNAGIFSSAPNCDLAAIVDPNRDLATQVAERWGGGRDHHLRLRVVRLPVCGCVVGARRGAGRHRGGVLRHECGRPMGQPRSSDGDDRHHPALLRLYRTATPSARTVGRRDQTTIPRDAAWG